MLTGDTARCGVESAAADGPQGGSVTVTGGVRVTVAEPCVTLSAAPVAMTVTL